MRESQLAEIQAQLNEILKEAGKLAQNCRNDLCTQQKADGSLVTIADTRVESFLRVELPKLVPGTNVWGEEEGYNSPGPNGLWSVDPIDGTTNFSFGSHFWGVTAGLIVGGEVLVGSIRLPDLGQTYSASKGLGATLNGAPLAPIKSGVLKPYDILSYDEETAIQFAGKIPGKMRYMGAWVVEAALVFDGVFRGAISNKASLYDVAGSIPILLELGGEIRYADGSPFEIEPLLGTRGLGKPVLFFPKDTGLYL